MPVFVDFSLARYEDGILSIGLNPATPIGGQSLRFMVQHHFGGLSGYIQKTVASGFNGASGITVTNSGQGQFNVRINSQDTSGLDYGAHAFTVERLDSGSRTVITEGYLNITPSAGA